MKLSTPIIALENGRIILQNSHGFRERTNLGEIIEMIQRRPTYECQKLNTTKTDRELLTQMLAELVREKYLYIDEGFEIIFHPSKK